MNNRNVSNSAGRMPRLAALAVIGTLVLPGLAAVAGEARMSVIDEIVVTAPRLTAIEEMVVTAPRIDPMNYAITSAIEADVQRATLLAGGSPAQRANQHEIRLASLSFRTDGG